MHVWLGSVLSSLSAVQPLIAAVSRAPGWGFLLSDSNTFPQLDSIRDAFHLLSLAACGPLVWMVVNMRLDEFNPMLYVFALPGVAVLRGLAPSLVD